MHQAYRKKSKYDYARYPIIAFVFVFVRGPLFRIENLTALGWDRVYAWKTVMSLVKAGILEKYDSKSYGASAEARKWFRTAFGGGVNDSAFAYSAMDVESWGKPRLEYFKSKLTKMWEHRPQRVRADTGSSSFAAYNEDISSLVAILYEKIEEVSYIWSLIQKYASDKNIAQ